MNNTFIKYIKKEEQKLEHICVLSLLKVRTYILLKLGKWSNGQFMSNCLQEDWFYDIAIDKNKDRVDFFKNFNGWKIEIDDETEHIRLSKGNWCLYFYQRENQTNYLKDYYLYAFESVYYKNSYITLYDDGRVFYGVQNTDNEMIVSLCKVKKVIEFCNKINKKFKFKEG